MSIENHHRLIRSFVQRKGRLTRAQETGLLYYWPQYGVELTAYRWLNVEELFGRASEKHLEIGFGMGDSLLSMAETHPDIDYLGIDVYLAGLGHVLSQIHQQQLSNVRVINTDAVAVLRTYLPAQTLDTIYIFFPDPWPKKRHWKRRLIQPAFVNLCVQKLRAGGFLYLATDWQPYAKQMLQILELQPGLDNVAGQGTFALRPVQRPLTKFERRGEQLGHQVWDLIYRKREF